MRKTYKYRLFPTKRQEKLLQLSLNACRWVYNKTLEIRKNSWETKKKYLSLYDTNSFIPKWKKENEFLKNAYSQCLQNAQERIDLAFKAFFRRCKKGENPGYPRFKGFDRYNSFCYPQSGFELINSQLKLSKIGFVKIKQHRPIKGTIKNLTIRRESNKWYACFSCEETIKPLKKIKPVVGIDVGLESFETLSTGEKISNPRFFRQDEKKLAKYQRKLSKAKKGTEERKKFKKIVSNIHFRIANKRRDFSHKVSLYLIRNFQIIVFEDLDIKQMQQKGFKGIRKSIGDAAWNQLIQFISYKAEYAGRKVILVDPRNTSKRCSRCGQIVEKKLSDRVHICSCGLSLGRDHNASINILALGLQSLESTLRSPTL